MSCPCHIAVEGEDAGTLPLSYEEETELRPEFLYDCPESKRTMTTVLNYVHIAWSLRHCVPDAETPGEPGS